MAVYILEYCTFNEYCQSPNCGGMEYTVIGVYTDVQRLEQDYIENFKLLKNQGEPHYNVNEWKRKDFKGGIEQGYVPHSMRVSKYLLNNDQAELYKPGSDIYNTNQAKIHLMTLAESDV